MLPQTLDDLGHCWHRPTVTVCRDQRVAVLQLLRFPDSVPAGGGWLGRLRPLVRHLCLFLELPRKTQHVGLGLCSAS